MGSDQTGMAKTATVCFMIVWIGFTLFMGVSILPFFPFSLIPFAMAAFGIFSCFVAVRGTSGLAKTRRRVGSGYSISTTRDAMYEESARRGTSFRRFGKRVVYQVPSRCPSCGASLNSEQVEWVGPLQAQCPYCLATVEAIERDF